MLKRAAAVFLVCASTAMSVSCGSNRSKYLYAAIPTSSEIVAYREDPGSGVLTELVGSPISAGQSVESIVIHPSGKYLYAANAGEGDVSQYNISSSGGLTEAPPRMPAGTTPTLLAMDPAGNYLYVANAGSFNVSVFSIAASTGTLTQVVGSPFQIGLVPINMQVSPSGAVLYVTGGGTPGIIEAFTITQGVLTAVPSSPYYTGVNPYGLAISANGGFLYTANNQNLSISEFGISSTDGSLSQLVGSPVGETYLGPVALLINKSGAYMYVANQASANLGAYGINSDGSLSLLPISPFATGKSPSAISSDASGNYLFVGNEAATASAIESFSLDSSSGALSEVASYTVPGNVISIAVTP